MLRAALLAVSPVGRAISSPAPSDAPTVSYVTDVVASTTSAWTAAFTARGWIYKSPRVLFLRIPAGHPSRGNGYSAGIGVLIDLDDMRALREINDPDARDVSALIVAHEVGHHVQALLATTGAQPTATAGLARERQADCYAGWWTSQAEREPTSAHLALSLAPEDLSRRLSRTLQILSLVERGGVTLRRESGDEDSHGEIAQRVISMEKGLASPDPWGC